MRPEDVRWPGLELLDHQLVDSDGFLCGNVDDVELEERDGRLVIVALLSGPGAWPDRLPRLFRGVARRVFFDKVARIPWEQVAEVRGAVKLRVPGNEVGIGRGEELAGRWLSRLPGSG
jgi:sporulation protein YlmC with PRC-barrel domain